MSTARGTWKQSERRVAKKLGARRQPLSGSSGRNDITTSDTTHERLYVEVKYRERHAVRSLFETVKPKAVKEGKIPVIALVDKHKHGFLLCVYVDDLQEVAREMANLEPPF